MSSIYRIEKIEQCIEIPSAWIIHLTLIDKNDTQLTNLTQSINQDQLTSELSATITKQLYQFKSIRKLFEPVFHYKTKQIRSVLLHYNMGIIYDCLKEYDKAIDEYKDGINLTRKSIPDVQQKDNLCLIPLYSNMGLSYQRKKIFSLAFDQAFRALGILSKDQDHSIFKQEVSASTHFNLGLIHELEGKFSEAKTYYEEALKRRREYLSNDHPDVISLQNTISSLVHQ
jgi:tetratricopeptide (TPR) repeat protein